MASEGVSRLTGRKLLDRDDERKMLEGFCDNLYNQRGMAERLAKIFTYPYAQAELNTARSDLDAIIKNLRGVCAKMENSK